MVLLVAELSLEHVWKHYLDVVLIGFAYNCLLAQSSLLLGFLFSQDVVFESTFTLDFTAASYFKSFLGT
jgi:hypothetical protein